MKNFLLALLLTVIPILTPLPLSASGTTTNSTSSGVVVRDENGVRYLSTTVIASDEATTAAYAQTELVELPRGFFTDFGSFFTKILRIVFAVAALLTFAYLIFGAFRWITSGGDKGKTEGARNSMLAAVVGLIIVAASYAILLLVLNFLGYDSLEEVLEKASVKDVDIVIIESSATPSPTPAVVRE